MATRIFKSRILRNALRDSTADQLEPKGSIDPIFIKPVNKNIIGFPLLIMLNACKRFNCVRRLGELLCIHSLANASNVLTFCQRSTACHIDRRP
jgi:hypothetical protein